MITGQVRASPRSRLSFVRQSLRGVLDVASVGVSELPMMADIVHSSGSAMMKFLIANLFFRFQPIVNRIARSASPLQK